MPAIKTPTGFDLFIVDGKLIMKDNQNPAHYWGVQIVVTLGVPTFNFTDLGTSPAN